MLYIMQGRKTAKGSKNRIEYRPHHYQRKAAAGLLAEVRAAAPFFCSQRGRCGGLRERCGRAGRMHASAQLKRAERNIGHLEDKSHPPYTPPSLIPGIGIYQGNINIDDEGNRASTKQAISSSQGKLVSCDRPKNRKNLNLN